MTAALNIHLFMSYKIYTMKNQDFRAGVLSSLGATTRQKDELLTYNRNLFDHQSLESRKKFPLPDELFVETWERYISEAKDKGIFEYLKKRLVQLSFPIREGISQTEFYRSATRKGTPVDEIPEATGIVLERPEELQLVLNPTPAGRIPVIIPASRNDFVSTIRAFTMRNEPEPVPDSMGATTVSGYNNWDRIHTLRRQWEEKNQGIAGLIGWPQEFQRIIAKKELYQDRFIILSDGPYSSVPAREMGLAGDEWRRLSLIIRREHECTHYFTLRVFSSMQNRLIDELLADYMGIVAAADRYRADWFMRFMGLENFPDYRKGGRLENYRGDPQLSDRAFKILQVLVKKAAENLERLDVECRDELLNLKEKTSRLIAITYLTLEELASDDAVSLLQQALAKVESLSLEFNG